MGTLEAGERKERVEKREVTVPRWKKEGKKKKSEPKLMILSICNTLGFRIHLSTSPHVNFLADLLFAYSWISASFFRSPPFTAPRWIPICCHIMSFIFPFCTLVGSCISFKPDMSYVAFNMENRECSKRAEKKRKRKLHPGTRNKFSNFSWRACKKIRSVITQYGFDLIKYMKHFCILHSE